VTIGADSARALISHAGDLFDAWDQEDQAASEAALAAVLDAVGEFRAAEPVARDDPDSQLWTRAATLAEGLEDLHRQATQRPVSPDGFRSAQLATYGALLQAQGQFDR
jgi:hypothetical protein